MNKLREYLLTSYYKKEWVWKCLKGLAYMLAVAIVGGYIAVQIIYPSFTFYFFGVLGAATVIIWVGWLTFMVAEWVIIPLIKKLIE